MRFCYFTIGSRAIFSNAKLSITSAILKTIKWGRASDYVMKCQMTFSTRLCKIVRIFDRNSAYLLIQSFITKIKCSYSFICFYIRSNTGVKSQMATFKLLKDSSRLKGSNFEIIFSTFCKYHSLVCKAKLYEINYGSLIEQFQAYRLFIKD